MRLYVIINKDATREEFNEHDDYYATPLFWSNSIGWASLPCATVFTAPEKDWIVTLPIDGSWLMLPEELERVYMD